MTAHEVREAIRQRYNDARRYAIAEEIGLTTGYSHRRLDMMVLDCYYSNGFRIDGIEIKVSTSDLRRELEDPEKHIAFFDVIDYFTLAAPQGVVDPLLDVIPKKWGILVVREDGSTRLKRRPLSLEDMKADRAVPRGFLASIVRSIYTKQPSNEELESAYKRGYQEAEKKVLEEQKRLDYRLSREREKLKEYDNLIHRFSLYGNIDQVMEEFEAFRDIDPKWLGQSLNSTIDQLTRMKKILEGAGKAGK